MNSKQMSFKRVYKGIAGLGAIGIVLVALFNFLPSENLTTLLPITKEIEPKNSLSGRIGSDGPVLAVKIDDTAPAHP
jgi:hypothetical protein